MIQEAIKKLSPSACRLLLTYLTCRPNDTVDILIIRSGITRFTQYLKAKDELLSLGILEEKGAELWLVRDKVQL